MSERKSVSGSFFRTSRRSCSLPRGPGRRSAQRAWRCWSQVWSHSMVRSGSTARWYEFAYNNVAPLTIDAGAGPIRGSRQSHPGSPRRIWRVPTHRTRFLSQTAARVLGAAHRRVSRRVGSEPEVVHRVEAAAGSLLVARAGRAAQFSSSTRWASRISRTSRSCISRRGTGPATVNGYSGFLPRSYRDLEVSTENFPLKATVAYLQSRGVTHVAVHCGSGPMRPARWRSRA